MSKLGQGLIKALTEAVEAKEIKMSDKPREFWILKTPGGEFIEHDEPMTMDWSVCKKIHVIEKSAFDAVVAELEAVKAMEKSTYDLATQHLTEAQAKIDRLQAENEKVHLECEKLEYMYRNMSENSDKHWSKIIELQDKLDRLQKANQILRESLKSADLVITQGLYIGSMTAPDYETWQGNCQTCFDEIRKALAEADKAEGK